MVLNFLIACHIPTKYLLTADLISLYIPFITPPKSVVKTQPPWNTAIDQPTGFFFYLNDITLFALFKHDPGQVRKTENHKLPTKKIGLAIVIHRIYFPEHSDDKKQGRARFYRLRVTALRDIDDDANVRSGWNAGDNGSHSAGRRG